MTEADKAGTEDNARRVRVEQLPKYREVRRLLRVWLAHPKTQITGLHRSLSSLSGTRQDPVDWKDPDTWIAERLSGEDRELAHAIWTKSGKTVNPKYSDVHWSLTQNYELLMEDADGKLELTHRGSDFIDHEFGKAEAFLDVQEGLIKLLALVAESGSARSSGFREPWADYLGRNSRLHSPSTIDYSLRWRLQNLVDRDLLNRDGSEYGITKAGSKYMKRVGAASRALIDPAMTKAAWDAYLAAAWDRRADIYRAESYKEDELAKALKSAREAVLHDDPAWPDLLKAAIRHRRNNIIFHINQAKLAEWMEANASDAKRALSGLWPEDDRTPGDRVRSFDAIVPDDLCPRTAVGTRLNWASYLMMGIDPHEYPPYQRTPFRRAYQLLDYPQPSADEAGGQYEHVLGFLDRMLEEARKRGMDRPSTRLDAQSVVWFFRKDDPEPLPPSPPPPPQAHHDLNNILYGPPGTGKTWHTVTRAVAIVEDREVNDVAQEDRPAVKHRFEEHRRTGQIEMVTFHQNTTYEDFVEGIRPVLAEPRTRGTQPPPTGSDGSDVQYEMSRGVFRRIAERAEANPANRYVLIIDEINRGNIARIFGELITLIEDSKRIGRHDEARVTLPGSKTDFGVPANLHVLGTMNTADRSIALLDTALRRRFVFVEMMPDPSHSDIANDLDGIDCGKILDAMNRRIAVLLDREHQIGHTYFLRVDTLPALARTFRNQIMPLLQEYFYDDWEKIRAVLNNNGFVLKSDPPEELVRLDLVDADRSVYDLVPAGNDRWTDAAAYRKIYGKVRPNDGEEAPGD